MASFHVTSVLPSTAFSSPLTSFLPPSFIAHTIFHLSPFCPPPPLQFFLVSSLVPHPTLHSISFFFSLHRRPPPLACLNACLFLHFSLSHTISFSLSLRLSFAASFLPQTLCLCSFLEFHSPQNTGSPLLVATRDAGACKRRNLPSS